MTIEPLLAEDVVEINQDECADTAENHALLDRDGLEAAVARPFSGYGDHETFPTLWLKAAALLHALASRQVFENGNKRTAWVAAVTFLEINGLDIGKVETVQSDMFVRAAGLDHSLEIRDLAEWFEVAHWRRRRWAVTDPRVEYFAVAGEAEMVGGTTTLRATDMHLYGVLVPADLTADESKLAISLVTRIHWDREDQGRDHRLEIGFDQEDAVVERVLDCGYAWTVSEIVSGGHPHHHDGIMPGLYTMRIALAFVGIGTFWFTMSIDDVEVARVPFQVGERPGVPESTADLY